MFSCVTFAAPLDRSYSKPNCSSKNTVRNHAGVFPLFEKYQINDLLEKLADADLDVFFSATRSSFGSTILGLTHRQVKNLENLIRDMNQKDKLMIEASIIQFLEETTALVVHFFLDQCNKQRTAGDDGETDKHPSSKYKHFQCIEPHYIPFSVQPVSLVL